MNEAEEKAVELAGVLATASNRRLERVIEKLIRTDPRLVEAVRRELSITRPVFETEAERKAYEKRSQQLHAILSEFLSTAATAGVLEATTLAATTGTVLGDSANMTTAVAGVAAVATVSTGGATAGESVVLARAMDKTLLGLDDQLTAVQKKNGRAVAEYNKAVELKESIRITVQEDPQAVNDQGEKLSLKLRGQNKQLPVIEATDLEAFDFLLEQGNDAAKSGRQEAELEAMSYMNSDLLEAQESSADGDQAPKFILVTDSGGCKICKTIAGDGFLNSGTIFIHKGCGCTLRISRRGTDDPVYKYNVANHGAAAKAAKKKAMERWKLTEEQINSDQYYALALGEAAKV